MLWWTQLFLFFLKGKENEQTGGGSSPPSVLCGVFSSMCVAFGNRTQRGEPALRRRDSDTERNTGVSQKKFKIIKVCGSVWESASYKNLEIDALSSVSRTGWLRLENKLVSRISTRQNPKRTRAVKTSLLVHLQLKQINQFNFLLRSKFFFVSFHILNFLLCENVPAECRSAPAHRLLSLVT